MNSEPNQPFDAATTVEHSSGGPEGPRPLLLARSMRDEIVSHLRGALPNEGCGLIASVRRDDLDLAIQFFPGANIDRSPVRYTMDPKEVIDAMREMRTHEWQLAAIVHSHPRTPAAPSRTDLAEAYYPDARLLIVSFAASEPELACWALMRERGAPSFRSARLQIEER